MILSIGETAEPYRRNHARQEFLRVAVAENNAAKGAATDHHVLDVERHLGAGRNATDETADARAAASTSVA